MQFNRIIFPAPKCSYSSESLFKDVVFIPKPKYGKDEPKSIPCLYLPYNNKSKVMIFFHGNAEDIGLAYDVLQELKACLKVSILAMEYPGYGLYTGKTDSEQLLLDAECVYDHLTMNLGVASSDIIIFGRSIGCSPACHLASKRFPSALILMSPFKSIKDTAKDLVGWLLSQAVADRFRNIDIISEVTCPVHIIHGQLDQLINFSHSQELYDNCSKSQYAKLTLPPRMDHNDFDFDFDLIIPVQEFFTQIGLDTQSVAFYFKGIQFSDEYYFPTSEIIQFEKTFLRSSIIWEIVEERKRLMKLKMGNGSINNSLKTIQHTILNCSVDESFMSDSNNYNISRKNSETLRLDHFTKQELELLNLQQQQFNNQAQRKKVYTNKPPRRSLSQQATIKDRRQEKQELIRKKYTPTRTPQKFRESNPETPSKSAEAQEIQIELPKQ